MNTSMNFEVLMTSSEFETAAEELERGFLNRSRPLRYRASRSPPPQRRPLRPGPSRRRPPRPFGYPWQPWGPAPLGLDATLVDQNSQYRRCMQECLESTATPPSAGRQRTPDPEPGDGGADVGPDSTASAGSPDEETTMHNVNCQCPQCTRGTTAFEIMPFEPSGGLRRNGFSHEAAAYESEGQGQYEGPYESEGEYEGEANWAGEAAGPFSEAEEIALAAELLSVSNEAELEQFLGNLWKGIKKVGSFVGNIAKPFSGVLKAVAKKALPFVGGALGSLIPIPGVGTAVGSALGGALSKALEMEFGEMELEDREFETARRFVRIAGTAAQQLAQAAPGSNPLPAIESALATAAQQHLQHFQPSSGRAVSMSGRWMRRGKTLVVVGT
jgi:hypothetical protein